MGLCANGKQPIIEWQYAGEEKQRIIKADNYAIEQEIGKCPVEYLVQIKMARNRINYCQTPQLINDWSRKVIGPVNGLGAKYVRTEDRYSCPNYSAYVGKVNLYLSYLSAGQNSKNTSEQIYEVIQFYEPHTVNDVAKIVSITRTDGQPDNCGNCIFTITKNGSIVYQKTTPQCPTVNVVCDEQCPPGTCQCDCGSMVCCYDTTTGKAVKNFRK